MKRPLLQITVALAICSVAAFTNCSGEKNTPEEDTEIIDPDDENGDEGNNGDDNGNTTPEPEPEVDPWEGGYPKGVKVEEFTDNFSDGKNCHGFIATIDFPANPKLRFNVNFKTNPKKTPGYVYENWDSKKYGKPAIVTNAGYFAGSTSVNIVISRSVVKSMGFTGFNWPSDENYQRTVYAVRSNLGQMEEGGPLEIQWAYPTKPLSFSKFPSALGNNEKTQTFIDEPTEDTPGAEPWKPFNAVGGGPRLVQDGKDVSTENYWAEVLDSGGTSGFSRVPRTGVGLTKDGKMIILVCDGRGMNGSAGFTLKEMAEKFISLGCVDAMNFDGGGSSAMIGAGGQCLNRPSDSGTGSEIVQRAVVSSIVISALD